MSPATEFLLRLALLLWLGRTFWRLCAWLTTKVGAWLDEREFRRAMADQAECERVAAMKNSSEKFRRTGQYP